MQFSLFYFILLLLPIGSIGRKPIMLVPGLMGTQLRGNVTRHPFWYCPKVIDDYVWVNDVLIIPPIHKCLLESLGLQWNNETNQITQKDGVSIGPFDFGGLGAISYADELEETLHIIPTYASFIEVLKSRGYVERESLFGIPFDWRFGMVHPDSFWTQVKELIEEAYTKNDNQKVVLIGHSMGAMFINYFCMTKTTKEWREKYIDSALLVAPSIGGSFLTFTVVLTKTIPYLGFIGELTDSTQKLGGVDIHFPNYEIFGDRTFYTDENGNNYSARELKKALKVERIYDSDPSISKIFEANEDYISHIPPAFDIPTAIVYNTAVETLAYLDRSKKKFQYSYGPGDMEVNGESFDYLCNKWNTTYQVDCFNVEHVAPTATHGSLMHQNVTYQYLFEHINNEDWKKLRKN